MNALYTIKGGTYIECNVCGEQINGTHVFYTHVGKHMRALNGSGGGGGFSVLCLPDLSTVGIMWMVFRFQQLCLIQPIENEIFIKSLENLFNNSPISIYSINNLFDDGDPFYLDLKRDVINIITTTNYQCGLCGGKYDCGLPSIEIAIEHAVKCLFFVGLDDVKNEFRIC